VRFLERQIADISESDVSAFELIFRHIHLHPALTIARAFWARRWDARMGLALAIHVEGFGAWLGCSIHSWFASSSSVTSRKTLRRMRWRVTSAVRARRLVAIWSFTIRKGRRPAHAQRGLFSSDAPTGAPFGGGGNFPPCGGRDFGRATTSRRHPNAPNPAKRKTRQDSTYHSRESVQTSVASSDMLISQ